MLAGMKGLKPQKGDKPMKERGEYEELAELAKGPGYFYSQFEAVAFLIGYQGYVDKQDFDNIRRLFAEGLID